MKNLAGWSDWDDDKMHISANIWIKLGRKINIVRQKISIIIDDNKVQDKIFSQLAVQVLPHTYIFLNIKGLKVFPITFKQSRISVKSLFSMAVILIILY